MTTPEDDRHQTAGAPPPWHVAPDALRAYAGRRLDATRTSSVDQHLLACVACRAAVADAMSATELDLLDAIWTDIIDDVDRPRVNVVEWSMRRLGVRDHLARLLAATPALRVSWLFAITITLLFAAANAVRPQGSDGLLLLVAPLVPLVGIATAYGRPVDPLFEIAKAAPLPASRLFLLRSVAVLATAVPLALLASLIVPYEGLRAVAWLAPALGLAGVSLALSTWIRPLGAAAGAGTAWLLALAVLWRREVVDGFGATAVHALPPFAPSGQVFFLGLALLGAAIFARRAHQLDLPMTNPLES